MASLTDQILLHLQLHRQQTAKFLEQEDPFVLCTPSSSIARAATSLECEDPVVLCTPSSSIAPAEDTTAKASSIPPPSIPPTPPPKPTPSSNSGLMPKAATCALFEKASTAPLEKGKAASKGKKGQGEGQTRSQGDEAP